MYVRTRTFWMGPSPTASRSCAHPIRLPLCRPLYVARPRRGMPSNGGRKERARLDIAKLLAGCVGKCAQGRAMGTCGLGLLERYRYVDWKRTVSAAALCSLHVLDRFEITSLHLPTVVVHDDDGKEERWKSCLDQTRPDVTVSASGLTDKLMSRARRRSNQ